MIYKISEEEVCVLEKLISTTSKTENNQERKLTSSQKHIYKYRDSILPNIEIEYYSTTNKDLNKKLSDILEVDNVTPITIHTFKYYDGAHSNRHRDTNSNQTFVIILEDDYEGGDFYLNDTLTEFRNRGDVANYVGKECFHHVTPITKGVRTVLVVWYPHENVLI
jgi:hypothetical protein